MSSPPYNALTLYTAGTPNGLKPVLILEELGLKYDVKPINIMTNEQKQDWYLDINPNGRIPALKDGDLRVFESAAIMLYVTDLYDKEKQFTYDYGTALYYEMLSWIMFQMGGIGPMQGQANHFRAFAPVYSAYGIKRYTDETKRLYGVLEIRLSKSDWLAGDKYTIADMANYSWTRGGPMLDIDMSEFPGVQKWLKRIEDRPAVQKARKIPDTGRSEEDIQKMIAGAKARVDALMGTAKDETVKDEL
ncbi:hypothetical protein H2200_005149 [Cladophialophora chaetospira]|uniref:Glutathione S-transferase n=1 Tax=Cladophialophora chaetospira TaxID=386627 RepID=A0AA38XBN4_9EURO|nr:hypothetical protein H2200_005149 [Cladophialophora chaetospira]